MEGDKRQERRHFLARHGTPSRLQRCGNAASGWWAGRVQDQPHALSPRTTPRTARQPSFGLLAAAGQSAASVPNIVGWGFHCWLGGIASTELGVGDLHSTNGWGSGLEVAWRLYKQATDSSGLVYRWGSASLSLGVRRSTRTQGSGRKETRDR